MKPLATEPKKGLKKPIVLVGFPSAGKSSVGKSLAQAFHCPFIDSDRLIEEKCFGMSCRDIFLQYGEVYFRSLEKEVIDSISLETFFVLATGGGTLKERANREKLKKGFVIYLKTSAEILLSRLLHRVPLPSYLSGGDPRVCFDQMFRERAHLYEEMADLSLSMDHLTIEQAVAEIYGI